MIRIHKKIKIEVLLGLALALHLGPVTMAMPTGGVVVGGSGSISTSGNTMNVAQQTKNMFINWDAFSVGNGEKVQFNGPQDFAVLNRVVGHDESKIYGEISAASHGNVYLINPNGILIGDGAAINTGSFIASTKDVIDVPSFIASGKVNFTGDARGNIINLGAVKADHIEMHGDTISLKAANVNQNFDAPQVLIDANSIHAGVIVGETTADVDKKLGVKSEVFQLKDTMQDIRKAVKEDKDGKYMLAQNDGSEEKWNDGDKPVVLGSGAIDGLGYTVAHKTITSGGDGTGMFGSVTGNARVDNFTFDQMVVKEGKKDNGTGILAGYLNGSDLRIANVTISNGRVNGYNHVGGLIGSASGTDTVTLLNVHNVNTSVTGIVEKDGQGNYTGEGIGGIIGYHSGEKNTEKKNAFYNVSNSGQITGRIYVGGLAGRLLSADMDQVRNTGRVMQQTVGVVKYYEYNGKKYSYIDYQDTDFIGGIAGAIGPKNEAVKGVRIRNAYNGGTIGADTTADDYYDSGNYIGGIVGMISGYGDGDVYGATDTIIEYAHNTGTVTAGSMHIGGIVGYATGLGKEHENNASDMIIRHSYNDGQILGDYSGGIVGTFGGTIEQSYNNGALEGEYSGGLVARTESDLYNDILIRDSYNTKNGSAHVGGIIGVDYTEGTTTLERVWNEADIKVNQNYSGGIIGDAQNCGSIMMKQVYNFGHVSGNSGIGGLIGHNQVTDGAHVTISHSANYGDISGGEYNDVGVLIGLSSTCGNNNTFISYSANFGQISGADDIGGFIGEYDQEDDSHLFIDHSYNYGTVRADDGKAAGGVIGYLQWGENYSLSDAIQLKDSGIVDAKEIGYGTHDFSGSLGAAFNLTSVPDKISYANQQFLHWADTTMLDPKGELGTETSSYPDGGYVWKMYETGETDGEGHALYHKPLLTAFMTKVATVKSSVDNHASDVAGALYDVTLLDGQQIKGIDWQRVLSLQDQFTRVQLRGDGTQKPAYTASNAETGGSVPEHLYGFYDSSQQGINVFMATNTVKPEEPPTPPVPEKPVMPDREVSRNDYLYSDGHDTGDSKPSWYMHMPPVIYVEKTGVQIGDTMPWKPHER